MLDQIIAYLNTTKYRFCSIICIISIIILLCFQESTENYTGDIETEIKKIVHSRKKPIIEKMINACKDGLVKGAITGCINGGFTGAVTGSAIFAIANPIYIYVNEM